MLLFLRRSSTQPQLSTTLLAQKSIGNLLVWMADNLDKDLSVSSLARRMAMSPRNFARYPSINFGLILAGSCLLIKEGAANVLLEAGDFLFLSRPSDYSLASDVNVSPLKAEPALAAATSDCLVVGDGQHCSVRIMPGYFLLNPDNPDLLTDLLLPVVHVATSDADASQFRLLLQLVSEEASQQLPGRTLVLSRFLDILLMRVLRCLISSPEHDISGLLAGLSDPQLAVALRAMQKEVSMPWKIDSLASIAGLSRSVFAARFRKVVGTPPVDYLIRWRIALAKELLRSGEHPLTHIADTVGYKSSSAFSTAFKRSTGEYPRKYMSSVRN
ncbi:Transcriptional regulator, AraC family [Granulicella sibirica]|uniref:Transcriptional regulator, AraC family n=1 Tax=Granulicella sibirica TaxID=2479048 RepID=A0A4Q0SXK2_9BACT|nr:Transcriptional regulator, AraC family [Granulicella sibirica]